MTTLKSKLMKLLMIGLLVLTAFAFIACGGNGDPEDEDPAKIGFNSGSSTPQTEEEISAKLAEIGDYRIVCRVSETGFGENDFILYYEIGRKDKTYWSLSNGHGYANVIDGEYIHSYRADSDENGNAVWEYSMPYNYSDEKIEDDLESMYNTFAIGYGLFYFSENHEGLTKKPLTPRVAGRPCTCYSRSESSQGATQTLEVYVDKQTGITMKVISSYIYNGETYSGGYEVTTFETGDDVTVPVLPPPEQ